MRRNQKPCKLGASNIINNQQVLQEKKGRAKKFLKKQAYSLDVFI